MSIELLDKTRRINRLLHDNRTSKVAFGDICKVLGELLHSHVYVMSQKGKVLGVSLVEDMNKIECFPISRGKRIDKKMNERFLNVLSTKENVNLETLGFPKKEISGMAALVTPICIASERLGTLFLYRMDENYTIEDIILSEYGVTVVGLEMLRSVKEEKVEENHNKKALISAIGSLSPLELKAMVYVLKELDDTEGTLVTSKLAREVGITRTVVVNALKKMESAGLVQTKSSGVKGTHIAVLSKEIYSEVKQYYNEKWNSKAQKEL